MFHVSYSKNITLNLILTGWPFCCADLDSRKLKTSPPNDVSRHKPHFALPPQNLPFGCIMRTPFVVRPSISTLSCHFVAFSCTYTKVRMRRKKVKRMHIKNRGIRNKIMNRIAQLVSNWSAFKLILKLILNVKKITESLKFKNNGFQNIQKITVFRIFKYKKVVIRSSKFKKITESSKFKISKSRYWK